MPVVRKVRIYITPQPIWIEKWGCWPIHKAPLPQDRRKPEAKG